MDNTLVPGQIICGMVTKAHDTIWLLLTRPQWFNQLMMNRISLESLLNSKALIDNRNNHCIHCNTFDK